MADAFPTPSPLVAAGRTRAQLRQALKQLRDALPERAQRERALDDRLEQALRDASARCVGAYCASRGEYDALRVVVRVGAELGWPWQLALPVAQPETRAMAFHRWSPDQELRAGAYGIDEPSTDTPVVEPDLLLVPCVGFAADGLRLGYGGGYYDRYLQHRAAVATLGLAFDACRVEGLQAQAHDRLLDGILTETTRYPRPMDDAGRDVPLRDRGPW